MRKFKADDEVCGGKGIQVTKSSQLDQSALKYGRRTFLESAMGELVCSGQLWARGPLETASQLQGRIARAFSSNSFVNTMDMTAAIEYILTAAQSLGSQDYYRKFRMTILGLAGVLFCENEQAQTKWIIICSEENTYLDA